MYRQAFEYLSLAFEHPAYYLVQHLSLLTKVNTPLDTQMHRLTLKHSVFVLVNTFASRQPNIPHSTDISRRRRLR